MSAGIDRRIDRHGYWSGLTVLAPVTLSPWVTTPPPRRRSKVVVAAVVAVALVIAGGAGWMLLRDPVEPVRLRLAPSRGDLLVYRLESSAELAVDIKGVGRKLSTQMDGLLKLDVRGVRGAVARVRGDLTLFSFVAQGSVLTEPRRFRRRMRVARDGPVYAGLFSTDEGVPVLMLPALSPLLPKREMEPGDVYEVQRERLFARKDPRVDGTTRFVRYEEVDGVALAVLQGTLTAHFEDHRVLGTGQMQVDLRARVDPAAGSVHDAQGSVSIAVVDAGPKRSNFASTETFRLLPPDS